MIDEGHKDENEKLFVEFVDKPTTSTTTRDKDFLMNK